jgi:hypothetical protein
MEKCFSENAIFVCKNPEAMKVKAYAYGFNDLKIISYQDFVRKEENPCSYDIYQPIFYYLDDIEEFIDFKYKHIVKGFGGNL